MIKYIKISITDEIQKAYIEQIKKYENMDSDEIYKSYILNRNLWNFCVYNDAYYPHYTTMLQHYYCEHENKKIENTKLMPERHIPKIDINL